MPIVDDNGDPLAPFAGLAVANLSTVSPAAAAAGFRKILAKITRIVRHYRASARPGA